MKKFIFLFLLFAGGIISYFDPAAGAGVMMASVVANPFGPIDIQVLTYAATVGYTLIQRKTFLTCSVTGNLLLNLTVPAEAKAGDEVYVKIISDASIRTITWGTGFTANPLTTVASKTHMSYFVFDGTNYCQAATSAQIN